ncbi:MAG: sigma-70 family polymerase sigma factor [Akkermansiaceae bacterium]|nr:sigma-70 family polymerase sigma factor [Akkermansiaceae bacterium]
MRPSRFSTGIVGISLLASSAMLLRHRAALSAPATAELTGPARLPAWTGPAVPGESSSSPAARAAKERRLRSLAALTDPLARSRALLLLVDDLGPADFPPLLAACREMHLTADADICRLLLAAWTKINPTAAVDGAAGDPPALKIVIAAWSSLDPQAAFDWVDRHATGKLANQLLPLVIPSITAGHPESAIAKLSELDEATRTATLPGITAEIMKGGDAAIENWLDSFAAGRPRQEALAAVVGNISVDHPQQALPWLRKYSGDLGSRFPATGATALFTAWSDRDPAAAREAFATLEPGTGVHREALQGLIEGQALKQDPVALAALLNQYPAELDFLLVYRGIALTYEKEPAIALDLLSHMPPDRDLAEYYGELLRVWSEKDANAAGKWLDAHEVPEEVRKRFEKK